MSDGISNGYLFRSAPGSDAELNFTAIAKLVQKGQTGRTSYFLVTQPAAASKYFAGTRFSTRFNRDIK